MISLWITIAVQVVLWVISLLLRTHAQLTAKEKTALAGLLARCDVLQTVAERFEVHPEAVKFENVCEEARQAPAPVFGEKPEELKRGNGKTK